VVAKFDGDPIRSNGGVLLLREADRRIGLLDRLATCFRDGCNPDLIQHTMQQLLSQRIYGLALGYEDLNDHDELRGDALLGLVSGKANPGVDLLVGKSTLNRLELSTSTTDQERHRLRCAAEPAVARRRGLALSRRTNCNWKKVTGPVFYPRHAFLLAAYQSSISSPRQNSTSDLPFIYSSSASRYLIRCGTPIM
jgi:Transposase DDE domain group 1